MLLVSRFGEDPTQGELLYLLFVHSIYVKFSQVFVIIKKGEIVGMVLIPIIDPVKF